MTSYAETAGTKTADRSTTGAASALRVALMWPVISLIITGMWHLSIEAIWPDLRNSFVAPVIAPILLTYGAWAGYGAVRASGSYVMAIVAGAILGVLPFMLQLVGFGILLGRGVDVGLLAGVFTFTMVLFGALIGGGFAVSARSSRA